MNWLKKGPELKLPKFKKPSVKRPGLKGPDLKPPTFLVDLYYDLRDRRLLPLVALVLVAIAAVPFLMGSDIETLPPATEDAASGLSTAKFSKLTVVEATPGLRDYRKRLGRRSETDPFLQQYSGSGGSDSSSQSESTSSSSSLESSVSSEDGSSTSGSAGDQVGGTGNDGGETAPSPASGRQGENARLIEFVFDVQISRSEETRDGRSKMSKPEVRRRVPTLAQLPGEKLPVVTLAGVNLHNGKVWILVSDEVHSLDGDFTCETRPPAGLCELLEIETGFPLDLAYGPDEVLYRIKITKIDAVRAGEVGDGSRSSRASFGGPGIAALLAP